MKQTALSRAIIGAGGGSEKPRTPIEAPDSLRSIAYARILDMVGEGEIYGFADQDNPLSCVFFNETPVANDDGSYNFKNFTIESRTGTQTQDPIKGFDGVESELAIGVELRYNVPWVRSITNLNVTSARVRISVPALTKSNPENGDVNGSYVSYRIEVATDGGSFNTVLNGAFRGKTTSKYERSHRIDLPVATVSGWSIRVTRFTADSDSVGLQNATYIESFAEIVDAKLRMPMTALVACVVDAEQFSNIPARAYRLRGRIIRVPSNYDPDTRTYDGVWDGTFIPQYSNNPAWCFYDMVTNRRYGLGHLVPESLVDKWALYKIGIYCDQLVSNGKGGFEPRFTTNLFLQSQAEALRVMQDMATMFRGIMYASGGTIVPVADMPESAVYTYNPTNVREGRFTYGGSSRKVRHTVALVSWNDPADFSRAKVEYVEDEIGIARYGYQPTSVIATGCASQSQARRFGRYLLATAQYETDGVEFSVGLDGTVVAPGKVVLICDPLRAGRRTGGRVVASSATAITVDILPVVSAGDVLTCIMPDGVAQQRDVVEIAGRTITVSPAFPDVPVAQSVWAVESTELSAQRVRVLAVKERSDGGGYDMTAIQQVEGKYAYADEGIPIDEPPTGVTRPPAIPSPAGITCTQRDVTDQYTSNIAVDLAWEPVGVATGYRVQWRQSDGDWSAIYSTSSTTVEVPNLRQGSLEVQVTAFDARGRESLPAFGGPFAIGAVSTPPGVIVDIVTNQEVLEQIGLDNQAAIAQEIIDRQLTDANLAITNAELAVAEAQLAVIQGQVGDILEADVWSAAATYPLGDLVQFNGKLYRSRVAGNVNHQPTGATDTYWEYIGNYASLGAAVGAIAAQAAANTTAVTNLDGELTALTSTVDQQATQIAGKASNAAVNLLTTRVATAEGNITANTNAITSLTTTVNGKASTSALNALTTRVTAAEGNIVSNANSITALTSTVAGKASTSALNALSTTVSNIGDDVTANSNSITSLTASLGDQEGNLILKSAFDDDSIGTWQNSTGTLPTISTLGDGRKVLLITEASGYNRERPDGVDRKIPAAAGEQFILSAYLRTLQLRLNFYGADGVSVGTAVLNGPNYGGVPYSTTVTAPANTAWITPFLRVPAEVYSGEATGYGRDFRIERVSAAAAANASAISSLDGRVSDAEGEITSTADALTALTSDVAGKASTSALNSLSTQVTANAGGVSANSTAITQVKASLTGGGNLLPNSDFAFGTAPWVFNAGSGGAGALYPGTTSPGSSYTPPGRGMMFLRSSGGALANGVYIQAYLYTPEDRVQVQANHRYIFSAFLGAHRGQGHLYISWYDAAGNHITYSGSPATLENGGGTLDQFGRVHIAVNAPSNAASAGFMIRLTGNAETGTDSYLFITSPMFEEVGAQQNDPSPYSVGAAGTASITQMARVTADNATGKINAAYTLILDVNGYVTGFKSENTGTTSTFSVVADKFQIVSPGGGSRTEYSNGNWRVYDASGVLRVAMGVNI